MTFLKCPECPEGEEKRYDVTQLQDHLGTAHLDFAIYRCRFCENNYVSHYRAISHMKMKCRIPADMDMQLYTEPLMQQNGQKLKEMNRLVNLAVQNYAKEMAVLGVEAVEAAIAPFAEMKAKNKQKRVKSGASKGRDTAGDASNISQSGTNRSHETDAVSTVPDEDVAGDSAAVVMKENPVETAPIVEKNAGEIAYPASISSNMGYGEEEDGSLCHRPRSETSDLTIGVDDGAVFSPPPSDVSSNPSDAIGDDFVSNVGDVGLEERLITTPEPAPETRARLLPARYYQSPLTPAGKKEEYSAEEMIHILKTKYQHAPRCSEFMSKGEAFPCGCDPEECAWIREVARLINENGGFWEDVQKNHPKTTRLFKIAMGFSAI